MPLQEIKDLLDKIIVFELSFKESILVKAKNLDEQKLSELKNILIEVGGWQRNVLEKISKENPVFITNLTNSKRAAEQELINIYKKKLEEDDRKKMQIILNKMESL